MSNFIALIIAGVFTENIVTSNLCGISAASQTSGTPLTVLKRCGVLTAVLLAFTVVGYPVNHYLLPTFGVEYLAPLFALLIGCAILFAVFKLSKKMLPAFYVFLKEHSSLLTVSALIMGLVLHTADNELIKGFDDAFLYALASGVGFTVVSFIFYAVNRRLEESHLPVSIIGLPLILIIASFISMAFSGLA